MRIVVIILMIVGFISGILLLFAWIVKKNDTGEYRIIKKDPSAFGGDYAIQRRNKIIGWREIYSTWGLKSAKEVLGQIEKYGDPGVVDSVDMDDKMSTERNKGR